MTAISQESLANGRLDLNVIAVVSGKTTTTITNRDNSDIPTVKQHQLRMLYEAPTTYAASITLNTKYETVIYNDIVYAPFPTVVPFTTSGTWATDESKFYVFQVTSGIDATSFPNTPYGNIVAVTTKAALDELQAEKIGIRNSAWAISVGPTGDYATIADALVEVSKFRPRPNLTCTITLQSTYSPETTRIIIDGLNLGWVTIVGTASSYVMDATAILGNINGISAFWNGINGAVLPIMNYVLEAAVLSPDKIGLYLQGGSHCHFNTGGIKNFYRNFYINSNSTFGCLTSDFSYSTLNNFVCYGSTAYINNSDLKYAGIEAGKGGKIYMSNTNCRLNGTSNQTDDIKCNSSSMVFLDDVTGGTTLTKNVISSSGMIIG